MKMSVVSRALPLLVPLILLASCRTAVDNVGPQNVSVLANGDALRKDAAQYAKEVGVPLDEALRRLKLQDEIGKFDAKLTNGEPATFGGLWIQHEPDFRVIVNMTSNAGKVADYARSTSFASIVEVRKVAKSLKQLEAEQLEADRTAQAAGIKSESETNVFENKVVMLVKNQQMFKSAVATSRALTLPEGVELVETPSFSVPMANGIAGQIAYDISSPRFYCTTGYTVSINGYKGITTAGHCDPDLSYGTGKVPMTYRGEWYGGSNDFQWYTSSQLTFQPWARDAETDSSTPGYRYIYAVGNRPEQPINAYMCKYGQTTKYGCGRIQSKTWRTFFPPSVSPPSTATYIRLRSRVNGQTVVLAISGDSGGPVYNGHKALGMISGGYNDPNNQYYGDLVYMAINYVTDQGFKVLIQPR